VPISHGCAGGEDLCVDILNVSFLGGGGGGGGVFIFIFCLMMEKK
jgi:hypothetical protein